VYYRHGIIRNCSDAATLPSLLPSMQAAAAQEGTVTIPLEVTLDRLFGSVQPRSFDVLDVTFPGVADAEIERLVSGKLDALWRALDDSGGLSSGRTHGQLSVTFYERRQKKAWFSMGEEEIPWEIWTVAADIYSPPTERDRRAIMDPLPDRLNNILLTILTHTSSEQGRHSVPPIRTAGVLSPFAFKIEFKVDGVEYRGSGD